MPKTILVMGTGDIAKDVGIFCVKKGQSVTWVSHNESDLIDLQAWVDGEVRMFMQSYGKGIQQLSASFLLYDELENDAFDVVLECTNEESDTAKSRIDLLAKNIGKNAVCMTTDLKTTQALQKDWVCVCVSMPLEYSKQVIIMKEKECEDEKIKQLRAFFTEIGVLC
jgi:hypothetical protein